MNKKHKQQTEQTTRRPRVRSVAYRWALERLQEALERAEDVKSDRLLELEHMEQMEAIEDVRRRLWGREVADSVRELIPTTGRRPVPLTRSNI